MLGNRPPTFKGLVAIHGFRHVIAESDGTLDGRSHFRKSGNTIPYFEVDRPKHHIKVWTSGSQFWS